MIIYQASKSLNFLSRLRVVFYFRCAKDSCVMAGTEISILPYQYTVGTNYPSETDTSLMNVEDALIGRLATRPLCCPSDLFLPASPLSQGPRHNHTAQAGTGQTAYLIMSFLLVS